MNNLKAHIDGEMGEYQLNNHNYSVDMPINRKREQVYFIIKRLMDIIGSLIGITLLSPIFFL